MIMGRSGFSSADLMTTSDSESWDLAELAELTLFLLWVIH
jgi:hypothetical protein